MGVGARHEAHRRVRCRCDRTLAKRMGHAGAIISGGKGTAAEKFGAFEAAGIHIARDPSEIGAVWKSLYVT